MKRSIFTGVLILGLMAVILPSAAASAHVLKTDGTVGAVLHISPDDDPISGKPNDYIVSFQDTQGHFRLDHCLCSIEFLKDDRSIKKLDVTAVSPLTSKDTFAFSDPGVYTVRVSGSPKQVDDFPALTLNYVVRVSSNGSSGNQNFPPLLWVGIGLVMVLIVLAAIPAMYNDSKTISSTREKK